MFNTIPLLWDGNTYIYRNQMGGCSPTLFTQGGKCCPKTRILIFKHRMMDKERKMDGTKWTELNITLTFFAQISVSGKVTTTRLAMKYFGFSQRCCSRFKSFGCDSDTVVERVVANVSKVRRAFVVKGQADVTGSVKATRC